MKKSNFKQTEKSVKKSKPSAKGVILQSAKESEKLKTQSYNLKHFHYGC